MDVLVPYLAIIVILILTGSGLPLPEEIPIIAAGVLAAHGDLNPWPAVACCLFGALAGDCMMYLMGYHFGRGVLRDRHWWVRFVTPEREAKVEEMFRRHGLKVFFIARFLVVVRSPLLLAAGIMRVPFRRFLLIDLVSASAVVATFFGLSYQFGEGITKRIRATEVWLTVAVAVVLTVTVFFAWRRHRRQRSKDKSQPSDAPASGSQQQPDREDAVEDVVYEEKAVLKSVSHSPPNQVPTLGGGRS
jgi:membrane protein DedA with SNARE-associated domain